MINLGVEYLAYDKIAEAAEEFLIINNIESVPVPIDYIAEEKYGIDIIPIPNLQYGYETEGFITNDFSCIYVDEGIYNNVEVRYRFTIAHELGHYFMHEKYLADVSLAGLSDWIDFQKELNPKDHDKLEFQGYSFAGLVLVPRYELKIAFEENFNKVNCLIEDAKREGISRDNYIKYATDKMATLIAPKFAVSTDVIVRRIDLDSLNDLFM